MILFHFSTIVILSQYVNIDVHAEQRYKKVK